MSWFIVPVILLVLLIGTIAWIVAANARRRGNEGRQSGEKIYDRNEQRKSPNAPPA
ncbi:MAG TPA: hypothetical protein VK530_04265 [Candidatus Acidoferrum sp.]|nr:hypothetical protein [Candidatus Acidoferrum sp.]